MIGADLGVRGVVLGGLLAEFVTTFAQLAFTLKDFRPTVDWQLWKGMLAYGLPFTPHQLQAVALDQRQDDVIAAPTPTRESSRRSSCRPRARPSIRPPRAQKRSKRPVPIFWRSGFPIQILLPMGR